MKTDKKRVIDTGVLKVKVECTTTKYTTLTHSGTEDRISLLPRSHERMLLF